MESTGIMAEIRRQLSEGKTAHDLIAEGYKSGSVYKVQWQLRKRGDLASPTSVAKQVPIMTSDQPDSLSRNAEQFNLAVENELLHQQVDRLRQEVVEAESLRLELDQAQVRIKDLEEQSDATEDQVQGLLSEADNWIDRAGSAQAALAEANHHIRDVDKVNQALMPLTVWKGHPCCVCGKHTDGIVNHETAAKLLSQVGHKECLQRAGLRGMRFADLMSDSMCTVAADVPSTGSGLLIVR